MNIEHFRAQLQEKQAQLRERIGAIDNDFKKGRSADFAEQTSESENDEVLDGIKAEAKHELQQVTEALQRIETNRYGICVRCEGEIALKRLEALPFVTTCINCSE